jgi:excinuclease ABC subunit C
LDESTTQLDAKRFLETLTSDPGVYRMMDPQGRVLYVGKARSLKRRVASYFRGPEQLDPKTRALMSHVAAVEVTATHTETEALLLENNLIKEHRPRYNIVLRDDKSFPYIHATTDQAFPRLAFHRGPRNRPGRFFGPYASAGAVRETLSLLQKLFQVRQCEDSFFRNRSRPCLQHQIMRCTAPCVGLVEPAEYAEDVRHAIMFLEGRSEQMIEEMVGRMERAAQALEYELAARYRDQIASLRRVQERQYISGARGDVDIVAVRARQGVVVVEVLVIRQGRSLGSRTLTPAHAGDASETEVLVAFLPQYYLARGRAQSPPHEILVSEPAEGLELIAAAIGQQAGRRVSIRHRVRGDRARWLQMAVRNADLALEQRLANRASLRDRFEDLREVLDLPEIPSRLECFDVSHTRGEETVASCVVFDTDGPVKSDYRRFNIRGVEPGDDYAAMHQAIERRYRRLQGEEGRLPDIVLIDGGKGQVAEARKVLAELQVDGLLVVGVAKGAARRPGLEDLVVPGREAAVQLPSTSPALHLIQQVRDEAHRFAITGHRARRGKARTVSTLEQIPGIGAKRRQRLLSEFGGLQAVARAGVEDLARVNGISDALARAIYDAFREAR